MKILFFNDPIGNLSETSEQGAKYFKMQFKESVFENKNPIFNIL